MPAHRKNPEDKTKRTNFSITQLARTGLGRIAKQWADYMKKFGSCSGLVEAIGRGRLFVTDKPRKVVELLAAFDDLEICDHTNLTLERLAEIKELNYGAGEEIEAIALAIGKPPEDLIEFVETVANFSNG